ncbi:lecithin retinol acyltransferase-like [Stigmatopora nigra]
MIRLFAFLVEKISLLCQVRVLFSKGVHEHTQGPARERPIAPPPLLRRGDLLEVPRTFFTHFGVYLGDGRVAHLIPDILPVLTDDQRRLAAAVGNARLIAGCLCRRAAVRVDSLEDFAYGSRVLPMERADGGEDAAEEAARRAEASLGGFPYSLLWNNCEHFVTRCRDGRGVSRQTDRFCERIKRLIRDQRSVLATATLGMVSMLYCGAAASTTLPTILIPFTLWMAG